MESVLNGGEEVSRGQMFLAFFFTQKHSKDFILCWLHCLKGAGGVKMYGFFSRFVKVFDSLDLSFIDIMKSESTGNQS